MDKLFHQLHRQATPLVLPNAWDAGSARLIASLGAQAIATTSAGVAWSLGYRDGDLLPLDEHLGAVRRIHRVLDGLGVPLSVDIESGYAQDPAAVGDNVARFIDAGAVGINLQDGSGAPEFLCRKLEAARAAAERSGIALYINVRCDVFARQLAAPAERVAETLRRAAMYHAAGADGLFVLGATDAKEIAQISGGTALLPALIAWPGLPDVSALAALGVRRVSTGSWIPQTLWTHTAALARGYLENGVSAPLVDAAQAFGVVNAAFPDAP